MSAEDLYRAAEGRWLAATKVSVAAQVSLMRNPSSPRALAAVGHATARVMAARAELLALAASLSATAEASPLECLACARARREGRPWGCVEHVAEGIL